MTSPQRQEWRRELRHWLTRLATVVWEPGGIVGRGKGPAPEPTMEDFVRWQLRQAGQPRAPGRSPRRIIRLEHPIPTQHRNEVEREVSLWPLKSNIIKERGGSLSTTRANGKEG